MFSFFLLRLENMENILNGKLQEAPESYDQLQIYLLSYLVLQQTPKQFQPSASFPLFVGRLIL